MTQFNQVFDGSLAKHVFIVGFIIFGVLLAYGILLRHSIEASVRRIALHGRTAMAALVLAVAISAATVGLGLFNSSSSGAVNSPVSISIIELQSVVDMKSLPE